eukprot:8038412-Alexandrium_andersonii.AAC.1
MDRPAETASFRARHGFVKTGEPLVASRGPSRLGRSAAQASACPNSARADHAKGQHELRVACDVAAVLQLLLSPAAERCPTWRNNTHACLHSGLQALAPQRCPRDRRLAA